MEQKRQTRGRERGSGDGVKETTNDKKKRKTDRGKEERGQPEEKKNEGTERKARYGRRE